MFKNLALLPFLLLTFIYSCGQNPSGERVKQHTSAENNVETKIVPAASRTDQYLHLLEGQRVAVFANHTSLVGNTHLVDTLKQLGINIKKIFAPEHGFRGTADAGEKVSSTTDIKTGIPVISLYGKKRKPTAEDLHDIDVIVFDIQDVGVRFFTYISSLEDLAESAIEFNKPLVVLDRPNPNGFYIDGPVLKPAFRSFLGMQEVPVVYGMTIGEYAQMLVGEKLIRSSNSGKSTANLRLTVISCSNYSHNDKYDLPVRPSPNLPDMASVYLYPSTCFFEGTVLSEGRGTDRPFQIFGHPSLPDSLFRFIPTSRQGAKTPKLMNQTCFGWDLGGTPEEVLQKVNGVLNLSWLQEAYRLFPSKEKFFINNGRTFNMLAGNEELIRQIQNGETAETIRESWRPAIQKFKKIRKKYLLYEDFE